MKKLKKGFTLLELVIVIAVIAILAAILIPTFSGIIKRSKLSNDTMLCKNLNTAAVTIQSDGKTQAPATMSESLELMAQNGFVVDKIKASNSDNIFVWDGANNRFFLYDFVKNNIIYKDDNTSVDLANKAQKVNCWIISETYEQTNDNLKGFSVYLKDNYQGETELNISTGIDVGTNFNIEKITYTNSGDKQSVVICTNGGSFVVDSANDTVIHHGFAAEGTVNNVDVNCYYENGTVGRLTYLDADGKIYFENDSLVYCYMNATADSSANVSETTKAENAVVYTYVDSGIDEAKGYAAVDKEEVTVTNGIVAVSTCHNHNEDYDIINIGKDVYIVCKCCGGFSKISTDDNGVTIVLSSDGIDQENDNNFVAKNNEDLPIVNAVATINYEKYYSTLAAAVTDAVDDETITMLKNDLLLNGGVTISKVLTIDLNGKQIGQIVNTLTTAILLQNGNLTVNDTTGAGKIFANAQAIALANANDILTLNGGTLQGATYGLRLQKGNSVNINNCNITGGSYALYNQAATTVNINGGSISGSTNGINTKAANCTLTISNCTISASSSANNSYAIRNQSAGTNSVITVTNCNITAVYGAITTGNATSSLTVNGGTLSGSTYGIVNTGTLTINGGTIKANTYYGIYNTGTLTMIDGTVIGGTHENSGRGIYNNGTATINGGTVAMNVQTVTETSLQVAIDNRKTLTINGGNVTSDVIAVFSTDKFDMIGGTITGEKQGIQSFGTTTITGGKISGKNVAGINVAGGNLVISNGEISSEYYGIYSKGTSENKISVTINGGEISAQNYGIYSEGTSENKISVTINGGKISSQNRYALDLSYTDATITNGTLLGANAIVLGTEDSTCKISGGSFTSIDGQVCYAFKGFFTISGGTFTSGGSSTYSDHIYRFTLNCKDENYSADPATAGFTVKGGTFYQFNPQNDLSEGEKTCFTPEGYHSEFNEETGYYTVVAD